MTNRRNPAAPLWTMTWLVAFSAFAMLELGRSAWAQDKGEKAELARRRDRRERFEEDHRLLQESQVLFGGHESVTQGRPDQHAIHHRCRFRAAEPVGHAIERNRPGHRPDL